jgi:hypothetical protein
MSNYSALPITYGDTKLVLLPKDPVWMHAYWEISQSSKDYFYKKYGHDLVSGVFILRVYDVTDIIFDGSNAHRFFDIRLGSNIEKWYINVGEYNRVWCTELGCILNDGNFIPIVRSNAVALPVFGVCDQEDTQWASYHVFDQTLFEIVGKTSSNFVNLSRQDIEKEKTWGSKLDTGNLFRMPTSKTSSSVFAGHFCTQTVSKPQEEKFFWLKADTEIVVYGATQAGAALTIQGNEVEVDDDGSFSAKFYLPDGKDEYTIEAVSSDGKQSKRIFFTISKQTK